MSAETTQPDTSTLALESLVGSGNSADSVEREGSLLDAVLSATQRTASQIANPLEAFLHEKSLARGLALWFGNDLPPEGDQIARRINRDIAILDALVTAQVNAVLHLPQFQRLEASWRGLDYLVAQADREASEKIKIRVLNASWKDLQNDFERASEFDQSHFFRLVYSEEFDMAGGHPFGVLLGDFEIRPRPVPGYPHDDVAMLQRISQVAAAAFCPFVAAVGPQMFGLDRFAELEHRLGHARTFEQLDYLKWREFRNSEDARFIGLVLPRVLMRLPYEDDGTRHDRFRYLEETAAPTAERYLWGNAVYALGAVLMRAFAESGWLAGIRGVQPGVEGGGLVLNLPVDSCRTDRPGIVLKGSVEVTISDELEKELSDLGFIPLCRCPDTPYSAFYSNATAQKPKRYDRPDATTNARLSAMLQYVLCVSRFAHYLKVLARDKIGVYTSAEEFEQYLRNWVVQYVTPDSEASADVKARFPLREADVQVRETPGKPGSFQCVMQLCPHFQLDDMSAGVRLVTELVPVRTP